MDRNFKSLKHDYSANSYLEVLDAEVDLWFQKLNSGYVFIQDNVSIHTARKVKEWFASHDVKSVADWLPYSPSLNPIKYIWWVLKKKVFEMFPSIATDRSESGHARQQLESALQAAWDTIEKESFDCLYKSMLDRIEACIKAEGWHMKY